MNKIANRFQHRLRGPRVSFGLRSSFVSLLILSAFLSLSCTQSAQLKMGVDKILVDDTLSDPDLGLKIGKEDVRQALQEILKKGPLRLKKGGPYVLRVSAMTGRMPPEPGGYPVMILEGQLRARQPGQKDSFSATIQLRADSVDESAGALLEEASEDLYRRFIILGKLVQSNQEDLIKALQDKRPWYRLQALNSLAKRKDSKSYEAVLPLLKDKDEAIALRAVGVLVGLGDPRAVTALTDLTRQRGPAFVRQIVYAVAAIGGPEAEAYLFTIATGHPDAAVRQVAQAAQKLLKSTKSAKQKRAPKNIQKAGQESNP